MAHKMSKAQTASLAWTTHLPTWCHIRIKSADVFRIPSVRTKISTNADNWPILKPLDYTCIHLYSVYFCLLIIQQKALYISARQNSRPELLRSPSRWPSSRHRPGWRLATKMHPRSTISISSFKSWSGSSWKHIQDTNNLDHHGNTIRITKTCASRWNSAKGCINPSSCDGAFWVRRDLKDLEIAPCLRWCPQEFWWWQWDLPLQCPGWSKPVGKGSRLAECMELLKAYRTQSTKWAE